MTEELLGSGQVVVDLGLCLKEARVLDSQPAGWDGRLDVVADLPDPLAWLEELEPRAEHPEPFQILMSEAVHREVLETLGGRLPEAGGLLIGPKNHRAITHFAFLDDAKATPVTFEINATRINEMMRSFVACLLDLKGVVHSHPKGYQSPSGGDLVYLERLFANPKNADADWFFFPIICDGQLHPFVFRPRIQEQSERISPAKIILF
jgi:hypothetical protein